MKTTADALQSLKPNAEWVLRGDELEWHDLVQTEPTQSEIDAEIIVLQAEYDATQYRRDRQARYDAELPMGDQFDAILKGFNQLRFDGQNLPADLDEVIGIWLGIKSAIPKE
jgi:hypothetical protein